MTTHSDTGLGWKLTGRHVLYVLIGFFGIIFAVNGVFVYFALSTHPGVETDNAYQKGVNYNAQIKEAVQERALGWHGRFENDNGEISVRLTGAGGMPLQGVKVVLRCERPATSREDRHIVLTETDPGHYTAAAAKLAPGRWNLRADAVDAAGHHFRIDDEIMVEP